MAEMVTFTPEAQRPRLLAAKQKRTTASLGAASSTPHPSCADSSEGVLETLQESVAYAQSSLRKSRADLQHFEALLEETGVKIYALPSSLMKSYTQLKRLYEHNFRHFIAAEAALRALQTVTTNTAAQAKPAEPPKSKYPVVEKIRLYQNVTVTVIDGKTVTKTDVSARELLASNQGDVASAWVRHYYFPTAEIPLEYAFVLEDDGLYYGATQSYFITYDVEEFLRLCQLEVDTGSEHVLDGKRVGYYNLSGKEPTEIEDQIDGSQK
jgi:hypothetical protein